MTTAQLFQLQSVLIMVLMVVGLINRRKRALHVKIMGTVIFWDILLVLQIELGRKALMKASNALENAVMLNIHVTIAVTTVLLYFLMIYTGYRLLKGNNKGRPLHRNLGWSVFILRILTFITSFWAVTP